MQNNFTTTTKSLLFVTVLLFSFAAHSQDFAKEVELSGYIRDNYTNEPAFGVTVYISSLKTGVATDFEGYYSIKLPRGTFNVTFSRIDMITEFKTVDVLNDTKLNILMKEKTYNLDAITVYSESQDAKITNLDVGKNILDIEKINSLPSFMGESDVVKSLILLPGVSTVGEGSSGFNVRGGGVDQNLILQDGAIIFNPSHVFGFFSAFNPAVVNSATLYKSGMPAMYGGRLSSVLDISLKEGDRKNYHVTAGIGLVASKLAVDGPIIEDKLSFVVGARASYSDWMLGLAKDGDFKNSSASFVDTNWKLSWFLDEKNKLTYSGYFSNDGFGFASDTTFQWSTFNNSLLWKHIFSESTVLDVTLVNGQYGFTIQDDEGIDAFDIKSGINYQTFRADLTKELTKSNKLFTGVEATHYIFKPGDQQPIGANSGVAGITLEEEKSLEAAVYIEDELKLTPKLSVRGGLRYSGYLNYGPGTDYEFGAGNSKNLENITDTITYASGESIATYGGLEPRVNVTYLLNPKSSIKASYNRVRQYLHLISNTAAVTPTDFWKTSNKYIAPEIGDQFTLGYFRNFKNNTIEFSVEAYYKQAENIVDFKDGSKLLMNEYIEAELINGTSEAYGIEFFLNKKAGQLTGWAGYTYSRTFRTVNGTYSDEVINKGNPYPANFDKPHDITFALTHEPNPVLTYGVNFSYSTGRPATVPLGTYGVSNLANVFNYSLRNQERIPDYHRMDVSMTVRSKPKFDRKWKLSYTLAVYNLYGHKNAYSVFFENNMGSPPKAYQLSVLGSPFPSLSVNFEF